MKNNYNLIAGHSLERLAALSDGIFAVAMTLLVLDLRVPVVESVHQWQPLWSSGAIQSERVLADALGHLVSHLLPYLMSFLSLGLFWVGQQAHLSHFSRSDRRLTWFHLGFLFAVSLIPFSTALLAGFITYRLALLVYWLNLFLLGAVLFTGWRYAERTGLVKEEATGEIRSAIARRAVVVQALYAFGLLLCVFNTYVSIAFIVLVQLNAALAPRIRLLDRF